MYEEIPGIAFWMTKESVGRFLWTAAAGMPSDLKSRAKVMSDAIQKVLNKKNENKHNNNNNENNNKNDSNKKNKLNKILSNSLFCNIMKHGSSFIFIEEPDDPARHAHPSQVAGGCGDRIR